MFEKLGFSSYERRAIYLLVILILGGVIYRVILHDRFNKGVELWVKTENVTDDNPEQKKSVTITPENPLDINKADNKDFQLLPGIGPVIAKRIIEYRSTINQFDSIEQLDDVFGIGPKKISRMKSLITVKDFHTATAKSKQ